MVQHIMFQHLTVYLAYISSVSQPDPPTGVTVSDIQPRSIKVSWNDQPDADSYIVQYNKAVGDEQVGLCSNGTHSGSVTTDVPSTSITVEVNGGLLRAFTTYSIVVVAVSEMIGSSQRSDPVIFTTQQTCEIL